MDFKFPDENFLADKIDISRRTFHREIKPQIIRDFKKELDELGIKNPDIGLDEFDQIVLADPQDHTKVIETKTLINLYSDGDE